MKRRAWGEEFHSSPLIFLIPLLFLSIMVTAQADDSSLRSNLTTDDHERINVGNMKYNRCLQEQALEQVDEHDDVRVIAARAVEGCTGILDDLETDLDQRRINPDFYGGIINGIKSRAIRRIMPGIMMHKAQGGSPAP